VIIIDNLSRNDTDPSNPLCCLPINASGPAALKVRMRRLADIIIACVLIAFILPLMAIVALAITYESQGPVLDRYECVGIGGRRFKLLKFRVTKHDPDRPPSLWTEDTTRVGQFLRYTRIEEVPQLINVVRGDMSLLNGGSEGPGFLV
jgi:lipopolysaccharide/colanic/teichoic acid biosynthesis glycosyltransferase